MSNLLTSLATAGHALDVYQQALNVVQNNITNSTTPGYATQSLNLASQPFDVASGLAGGVAAQGWTARATSTRKKRFAVNYSPWGSTKRRRREFLPLRVCSM